MITISPLFVLGLKTIGLISIAALLFSTNVVLGTAQQNGESQEQQPASDAPLAMIGQQYFADGTGIAYFNDGTTQGFEHTLTEDEGYYFDESTPFYIGAVPEVGNNTGSVVCNDIDAGQSPLTNSSGAIPSSIDGDNTIGGNTTNVTIIRGASILEDKSRAVDPSPIVTVKVNDTVKWINEDTTHVWLVSPPITGDNDIPYGTIIPRTIVNENGGALACTFSEPGGFHYTLRPFDTTTEIKGAVIVTEGNASNTTTSTEQGQEQPSSTSPFSQQLQRQQNED
jgi:plastocyanin